MKGWQNVDIGELVDRNEAEIKTGPFGTQLKASEYVSKGTPVINVRNIGFGKIREEKLEFISDETVKRLSSHLLQREDIVFGRKGAVERHAFILKEQENWFQGSDCLRLRIKSKSIVPKFLSYYLLSDYHKSWIMAQSSHGATMASLNQDIIKRIKLKFPPLPTQKKIATILSNYDDLIENNTKRIKILEEMAQALYREWFVHFRFPGHESVKMVDSPLGKIPEGWEMKELREICQLVNYGFTAKASKEPIGPKFLRITDIVPFLIDWDNVPYCEIEEKKLNKFLLVPGDIVIARTGATCGYAKRINKRHPKSVFASYLVRIRVKKEYSNYLIGQLVESDEYKRFVKANISGAAQPQANAQVLTSFNVLLPSKEIQEKFDQIVENFADQKEILQIKNLNLKQTRDLLLPRLISGEIDVSELEIDIGE